MDKGEIIKSLKELKNQVGSKRKPILDIAIDAIEKIERLQNVMYMMYVQSQNDSSVKAKEIFSVLENIYPEWNEDN